MASERLRVALVVEACLGGVKRHVLDLCRGLDAARFELTAILAPGRDPDPEDTRRALEGAGVRVLHVPMLRGLTPAADRRCVPQLEAHLRSFLPHIVHCHSAKAGLLGRVAARRAGIPGVVYTPHGFPFIMQVRRPWRALYRHTERSLARSTSRIVCVCESERQVALEARVGRPEQLVVIPNGIEFGPAPEVDRTAKLAELGLSNHPRLILCVGDYRAQKGHAAAMIAMEGVMAKVDRAHLLIAGEEEPMGQIRRLVTINLERMGVAGRVHSLGPREDVPELLAVCDVVCQPSLWEGCPYAVIEAAGMGCAIVGSDIPGIRDIVQDGKTGWLFPVGDHKALARTLVAALSDRRERLKRGAAAAWFVRQHYTLERMVELTGELYEEVALEGRLS